MNKIEIAFVVMTVVILVAFLVDAVRQYNVADCAAKKCIERALSFNMTPTVCEHGHFEGWYAECEAEFKAKYSRGNET